MSKFGSLAASCTRLLREPMVWFLLAALGIFSLQAAKETPVTNREAVAVSARDVEELVADATRKLGRAPADDEVQALFQAHIEREILLQEARRSGLFGDPQVEALVLEKLRFVLGDAGNVALDDAALRSCYDARPDSYRLGESFAFEAVYFPDPGVVPPGLRDALNDESGAAGALSNVAHRSDRGRNATRADLVARFGTAVEDILRLAVPTQWHGPLASDAQVSFVRLLSRRPASLLPFEEVRDVVEVDCLREAQSRAFARALAALVARAAVNYDGTTLTATKGRFSIPSSKR